MRQLRQLLSNINMSQSSRFNDFAQHIFLSTWILFLFTIFSVAGGSFSAETGLGLFNVVPRIRDHLLSEGRDTTTRREESDEWKYLREQISYDSRLIASAAKNFLTSHRYEIEAENRGKLRSSGGHNIKDLFSNSTCSSLLYAWLEAFQSGDEWARKGNLLLYNIFRT